jgi:hypothetical protein
MQTTRKEPSPLDCKDDRLGNALMLALEPRYLYDAAAAVDLLDTPDNGETDGGDTGGDPGVDTAPAVTPGAQPDEIVFVDPSVDNYQELLQGISPDAVVYILDASQRDGVTQISEILAGIRDLEAVHLISHGRSGAITLGTDRTLRTTIDTYAAPAQSWDGSLADGADLLVYGCDVAAGKAAISCSTAWPTLPERMSTPPRMSPAAARRETGTWKPSGRSKPISSSDQAGPATLAGNPKLSPSTRPADSDATLAPTASRQRGSHPQGRGPAQRAHRRHHPTSAAHRLEQDHPAQRQRAGHQREEQLTINGDVDGDGT